MRKIFIIAAVAIVALALAACPTDGDDGGGGSGIPDGIVIKTAKQTDVGFALTGTDITINWGDDTPDSEQDMFPFWTDNHNYTDGKEHTITITGKINKLTCNSMELTSLDVRAAKELEELNCHTNKLTSLNVSKNTALVELFCPNNELESLNVKGAAALQYLLCYDNELKSLKTSGAPALIGIDCSSNALNSLDVSRNTMLEDLICPKNDMKASALNTLFKTLPNRTGDPVCKIYIYGNPGAAGCNQSLATAKKWTVVDVAP